MADTPVQYAVGMDHLLDQIPYLEAKRIKQRLLMTYGKNKFYQFKRKERTFSPEDQQYIRQVFRAYRSRGWTSLWCLAEWLPMDEGIRADKSFP